MKKNLTSLALVAAAASLLPSCAPFPSTTPVIPRLSGSVVDAQSKKPIPSATVSAVRAGYTRRAATSVAGLFTLPPASQWHYLLYIGSPGVAPVPWHLRNVPASLTITASAPGYQSSSQTFEAREEHRLFLKLPDSIQIPLRKDDSHP